MIKKLSIIVLVLLASCNSEPTLERLNIMGYSIGDTIDDGVSIVEKDNDWYSTGLINNDNRTEVRLFNNHIEWIIVNSLSKEEFESLKLRITDIYFQDPIHRQDTVFSFIPFYGEEFYWHDSVSGDEISLIRSYPDSDDNISRIWFENTSISSAHREQIFGPEEEYEFMIFDDEE